MQNLFAERIWGVPWLVLAAIGLAIAVFYAFLPAALDAEGARWVILRWGHTIAWIFLAGAAFARARVIDAPVEVAAPLAATGGLVYVALMVTTLAGGVG